MVKIYPTLRTNSQNVFYSKNGFILLGKTRKEEKNVLKTNSNNRLLGYVWFSKSIKERKKM